MTETGYAKFRRCMLELWRHENGAKMEPSYYRYTTDFVAEYVTKAELAWPGNEAEGPRSISGGDHLRDHLASDWQLSEREEIRFRTYWLRVMNYGFGQAKDAA